MRFLCFVLINFTLALNLNFELQAAPNAKEIFYCEYYLGTRLYCGDKYKEWNGPYDSKPSRIRSGLGMSTFISFWRGTHSENAIYHYFAFKKLKDGRFVYDMFDCADPQDCSATAQNIELGEEHNISPQGFKWTCHMKK